MKWLKWTLIIGIALTAFYLMYSRNDDLELTPEDKSTAAKEEKMRNKMRNRTLV